MWYIWQTLNSVICEQKTSANKDWQRFSLWAGVVYLADDMDIWYSSI